jgi:cysteinyl-tRNA synthetase
MKLYNTRTRTIEPFLPIQPPNVSMYVCGVTVYDHCHIGHARAYVAFDLLKRVLTHAGYTVNHVQNFTDIDDKIIDRARQNNESIDDLTRRFIDAYFEDMTALNILPATHYPKATDHIPQMIRLIETLIKKDAAYVANHHVYFRVSACESYGALSKKNIDELQSGSRVAIEEAKASSLDFVLWKPSNKGEPFWESPWGPGRPGWHTECVAMIHSLMGDHIDIHGGGADLQFPHHENELAQANCAYHSPFVSMWIHNGFVTIDNHKMSKSLKNFFKLRDVLKDYSPDVVRFFLLRTHYRAPLSYSTDTLNDAQTAYQRLTSIIDIVPDAPIPKEKKDLFNAIETNFWAALYNDLNISEALAHLFELHGLIHAHQCGTQLLYELGRAIGLFNHHSSSIPDHILQLADQRWAAKKDKNYAAADDLRRQIETDGFLVEDTPNGCRVRSK